MAYEIVITENAFEELRTLSAYHRSIVLEAIGLHLKDQPTAESRSRIKKLIQPAVSEYRLRVDEFRVYYDVIADDLRVVVLHIIRKGRNVTLREDEV